MPDSLRFIFYLNLPGRAKPGVVCRAGRFPDKAKTGGGDGNRTHVRIMSDPKQATCLVSEYTNDNPRKQKNNHRLVA